MSATVELPIEIVSFAKNRLETVHVRLDRYQGIAFVDIRLFTVEAGQPKATKKGLALRPVLIPDLIAALLAAEVRARELGLLDGGAR
jgi:hypothetical protein